MHCPKRSVLRVLAALVALAAAAVPAFADPAADPAVAKKLYDLGYPTDHKVAIQRWRADTDRRSTGPLSADETAALLAHPMPEFFAAMVGNPFTGLGVAMRHKSREAAEREAIKLCKAQGGGSTCTAPLITRAEHCVVVIGYNVTIDRRPTYRTSVAVSPNTELSTSRGMEGCQVGATHPHLCKPLLSYCGDGRSFQVFDGRKPPEIAVDDKPAETTAGGN